MFSATRDCRQAGRLICEPDERSIVEFLRFLSNIR